MEEIKKQEQVQAWTDDEIEIDLKEIFFCWCISGR